MQPDITLDDLNGERLQKGSNAGAGNAFARERFVSSAMGLADEVRVVGIEEASVAVIERDGDMTANVFVGDDLALENGDETLALNAFLAVSEFKRLFLLEIGKGN